MFLIGLIFTSRSFLFCQLYGQAQTTPIAETFTVKEGLSENVVYSLMQDKKGFIWIGTHEGLNRYDGYSFQKFLHRQNDSTSLPNSPISAIYSDKNGEIILYSAEGLTRMDPLHNIFRHLPVHLDKYLYPVQHLSKPGRPATAVNLIIDRKWYPSVNDELQTALKVTPEQRLLLADTTKLAKYFDPEGRLWILGTTQLSVLDRAGNLHSIFSGFDLSNIKRPLMSWLLDDQNGYLWLRLPGKMVCFNKKDLSIRTTFFQSQLNDLPFENIQTLLLDRSDVLWIGSFYGLKKINLNPRYFRHLTSEGDGLASNFTLGLNIYKNKLLVQHYFLDSFYTTVDLSSRFVNKTRISDVSIEQYLREVLVRDFYRVHIKNWPQQVHTITKQELDRRMIRYLYADQDGRTWSFYHAGILFNLVDSNRIIINGTAEEIHDDGNCLWIASTSQGLIRYKKSERSVSYFRTQPGTQGSIASDDLLCIEPDSIGNLWIGTRAGGICYFDKSTEKIITYTRENGLSNNTVYNMVFDDAGNLWMGTAQGLSCLNPGTGKFRNFYLADGLRNTEYNRWSAVKDENGNLYFGGMNGIDYFNPADVLRSTVLKPTVQITAFKTGNDLQSLQPDQSLHHRQNFISFEFSSLDFRNPLATQYMYKLQGGGGDWIRAEGNHTAAFAALPPGRYTFIIKASAQDGIWSEEESFSFRIRAPWWQQGWFYSLCVIIVLFVLYLFYRLRINQLKKVMAMRARISRDLHDDVGASLSSIHIYSSVAQKALQNDQRKANAALEKINESSRKVLEDMSDIVWALSPLDQDNKSFSGRIKNYGSDLLAQKQIECNYQIDPQAERRLVNPDARKNILLIVKEALNNIAKYSEATEAQVSIKIEGHFLTVAISDNGKGIKSDNGRSGNGILNMKRRTEEMGGSFSIESEPGNGTRIECMIPVTSFSDTAIGKV